MTRIHFAALSVAAVCLTGATAFADTLHVPRDHATLARAVEKARPGDRIVVRGVQSAQGVVIDVDRIRLVGKGAELHGNLTVSGDRARMQGFDVRGTVTFTGDRPVVRGNVFSGGSVSLGGARARLKKNRFVDTNTQIAALVSGSDAEVVRNEFDRVVCGVIVTGDDARVIHNEVDDAVEVAVMAMADGVEIAGNSISGVRLMDAITVEGDGADVHHNDVSDAVGGVRVDGNDATVDRNEIEAGSRFFLDIGVTQGCPGITVVSDADGGRVTRNRIDIAIGTGLHLETTAADVSGNQVVSEAGGRASSPVIEVVGDANRIRDNVARVTNDALPAWNPDAHGIVVDGDGNSVEDNQVQRSIGSGIVLEGDHNVAVGNVVEEVGDHAVAVSGDANQVKDNTLDTPGGDGIVVAGSSNVLTGNSVRDAGGCGVLLQDSAVVTNCVVRGCDNGGLVNQGDGSQVTDSEFTKNTGFDIADLGRIEDLTNTVAGTITDDPNAVPDHDMNDPFPVEVPRMPEIGGLPDSNTVPDDGRFPRMPFDPFDPVLAVDPDFGLGAPAGTNTRR